MPAGGMDPSQVGAHIEALRRFIGIAQLDALTQAYRALEQRLTAVELFRLRERQPLIEGFEAYRRATMGYRGKLKHMRPELYAIGKIAANFSVVAPTLSPKMADHHRTKLVDFNGQLAPLLLEWVTAETISRAPGCELAWFNVDDSAPEFAVRAQGLEWEMECKWQSPMVIELLGDNEAARFAGLVTDYLTAQRWQGEIEITVPADNPNQAVAGDIVAQLQALDFSAPLEVTLARGLQLRARLQPSTGRAVAVREWEEAMSLTKHADSRLYAMGRKQGDAIVDPLVLQLAGPQRTGEQTVEQLWSRKFRKAAEQCTGQRAAGLMFEWEGIAEASTFGTPALKDLMARTFDEFRHVTFIGMRCVQPPIVSGYGVDFGVPGYSALSNVSPFQAEGRLLQSLLRTT
jgi:hypothetical protein